MFPAYANLCHALAYASLSNAHDPALPPVHQSCVLHAQDEGFGAEEAQDAPPEPAASALANPALEQPLTPSPSGLPQTTTPTPSSGGSSDEPPLQPATRVSVPPGSLAPSPPHLASPMPDLLEGQGASLRHSSPLEQVAPHLPQSAGAPGSHVHSNSLPISAGFHMAPRAAPPPAPLNHPAAPGYDEGYTAGLAAARAALMQSQRSEQFSCQQGGRSGGQAWQQPGISPHTQQHQHHHTFPAQPVQLQVPTSLPAPVSSLSFAQAYASSATVPLPTPVRHHCPVPAGICLPPDLMCPPAAQLAQQGGDEAHQDLVDYFSILGVGL